MTPKEKATELQYKFLPFVDWNDLQDDCTNRQWALRNAMKSALITVDELINATQYKCHIDYAHNDIETVEYWEEVKEELNKL